MEKEGRISRIGSWFNDLKKEFKKISWPNGSTLTKQTGAVIAVSVVLGIFIAILDFVFQWGIDWIIQL